MLKEKAEKLAKEMDHTDDWLSHSKGRHDILFEKAHGEKGISADSSGAEEWLMTLLALYQRKTEILIVEKHNLLVGVSPILKPSSELLSR